MKKIKIERILGIIPDTLKNISQYLKARLSESEELIDQSSGSLAILVKFFGQEAIDNYFDKISSTKLANFGALIYLKSALQCTNKALTNLDSKNQKTQDIKSICVLLEDILSEADKSNEFKYSILILNPEHHPIVEMIKEKSIFILRELDFQEEFIDEFVSNFNREIEDQIRQNFGEDYEEHIKQIKNYIFDKKESKLLKQTYQLRRIGFTDDEDLAYEESFGEWRPIYKLETKQNINRPQINNSSDTLEEKEHSLVSIENLIEQYFTQDDGESVNKILFAIADFGKGKTVFMRQYASNAAKKYVERHEGYFPIYFNLRNYNKYSSRGTYGVIGDFLLTEYGIKIEDEYFKKKDFIFLVDSLDESGELNYQNIERVISSVKSIQNIDKEFKRKNRIIITSRPFPDGLPQIIKNNEPFQIKDNEGKAIPQFISLYGFKANQFNHWLEHSLSNFPEIDNLQPRGFSENIVNSIKSNKKVNFHSLLLENHILSLEELKRPIFSYMIYQLIIHDINFSDIGKVGIYLSFINLLTREAKHVSDSEYEFDAKEEISYRSILHSIAALWSYQRQRGQQGILKKSDICRVLEGKRNNESDKEIIDRFKEQGIMEIEFLSHSYFGENNNSLHFQHQSFAEILIAEYYLKVFIKFSLDKKLDIEKARLKLSLGEPTDQTMQFFKELIVLLKQTVDNDPEESTLEKRKLLYPLLASLANQSHNTLYSDDLYYDWFRLYEDEILDGGVPDELIKNWPITNDKLEKIIDLSIMIIESSDVLILVDSFRSSVLFEKEVTTIQNGESEVYTTNIDKWLALVVGNLLVGKSGKYMTFNSRIKKPEKILTMLKNWASNNRMATPYWAGGFFQSLQFEEADEDVRHDLSHCPLIAIDFSNSKLSNVDFSHSYLALSRFENCTFENVSFEFSSLISANFDNIKVTDGTWLRFGYNDIAFNVSIPPQLSKEIAELSTTGNTNFFDLVVNDGALKTYLNYSRSGGTSTIKNISFAKSKNSSFITAIDIFETLRGILILGLQSNKFTKEDIKSWFSYRTKKQRDFFEKQIDELEV